MTAREYRTRTFPMGWYWLVLIGIVVVAFAPMGASSYVDQIAQANNCRLNDGGAEGPCLSPTGEDLAPQIRDLMGVAWMMILTLPAGFVAFLAWGLALIVHKVLWRRAEEKAA